MPLTDQEKNQLWPDVVALVYAGEPEALLATLRRAAQRHAELVNQGVIDEPEAARWQNLANALAQAELTIEHMNAPSQLKRNTEIAQNVTQPTPNQNQQNLPFKSPQAAARQTTNADMAQTTIQPPNNTA